MLGVNKNYGWILCSSKSIPGKFYYFNPQTRQAVWDLNDLEKHVIPQNYFQEKFHNYPEPDTPPMEAESSLWFKKDTPAFSRSPMPNYSSTFPKPNLDYRNWTPITANLSAGLIPPMYLPRQVEQPRERDHYLFQNMQQPDKPFKNLYVNPNSHLEAGPARTKWGFDRIFSQKPSIFEPQEYKPIRRNYQEPLQVLKKPILRDSSFQLYRTPNDSTNNSLYKRNNQCSSEPRLVPSRLFESSFNCEKDQLFLRTKNNLPQYLPKPSKNLPESFSNFRNLNIDNTCKINLVQSKSLESLVDCEDDYLLKRTKNNLPSNLPTSSENLSEGSLFVFPNLKVGKPKHFGQHKGFGEKKTYVEVQNPETCVDKQKEKDQPRRISRKRCLSQESLVDTSLDCYDLRHLLMAKRRKSTDGIAENPIGSKTIKTSYSKNYNDANVSKKKVTFNLDMDVGHETEEFEEREANTIPIYSLRELREDSDMALGKWYIVADFDVLVQHIEFLDSYVQSDDTCILLIPIAVRKEIENLCVDQSAGKRLMMAARKLTRKIDSSSHIKVQLCEEDISTDRSVPKSILQCCLQLQRDKHHVVLITENEHLYIEAEANGIYCFKVEEIKYGAENKISFDPKYIAKRKTFSEVKENLITDNIPVNCFRKKLFEIENNDENLNDNRLFLQNYDLNANIIQKENRIENKNSFLFSDCINGAKTILPPKNRKKLFEFENNDENLDDNRLFFQNHDLNANIIKKENRIQNKNSFLFSDCINEAKTILPPKNTYKGENIESSYLFQRNSGLNPKKNLNNINVDNNKSFLFSDCKDKTRQNFPPKNVTRPSDFSDDTNLSQLSFEIKKINFNEMSKKEVEAKKHNKKLKKNNQGNIKHTAVPVNSYNLEEHLKKFCKEYKINEENSSVRIEEIICSFTQVMEESLTEVLQENQASISLNYTPPYTLLEAIECIRDMYDDPSLKVIVEKFIYMLVKYFGHSGVLKPIIKPIEFMTLLGCGVLLINCLNNILSSPSYLLEAEKCLLELSREVCSSRVPSVSPPAPTSCREELRETRANFVKSSSDIMSYLKRHYPDWRHTDFTYKRDLKSKEVPKILRTTGKNIKINHNKNISLIESKSKDVHNKGDICEDEMYMYIRHFLINLNKTFLSIHHFLNSITELKDDITEQEKKKVNYKTVVARNCIEKIIECLMGIIEREYDDSAKLNPKLTRSIQYRQIIEKYLDQAKALQNLLKSYKV